MQYVRLQCRRARGGTFEFQLETQMLDVGERDAQCLRGCPVATQPLRALLACGGAETCRVHVALPVVGSGGVAGAFYLSVPAGLPPRPMPPARPFSFFCSRGLRATSFCFFSFFVFGVSPGVS